MATPSRNADRPGKSKPTPQAHEGATPSPCPRHAPQVGQDGHPSPMGDQGNGPKGSGVHTPVMPRPGPEGHAGHAGHGGAADGHRSSGSALGLRGGDFVNTVSKI